MEGNNMMQSLGNQSILEKIDSLRALNVGTIIPLPQIVVVGDQSSGKSSLLESLTGFCFPRAATLCTRYATQITCTRDPTRRISISIIPRPDAHSKLKRRLLAFRRELSVMDNDELAAVFCEANTAMRICMRSDDQAMSAFSKDILKIEIAGPEEVHLTVIDVPGIFRNPELGFTTEADAGLVRKMVTQYMKDSRTIILAVMSGHSDFATQEILKLAEKTDPAGVRTMGVLTKADMVLEKATRDTVINLLSGQRNKLKLGYFAVRNRTADDTTSSADERLAAESAYFSASPWTSVADRCGIPQLKARLRQLLLDISQRELSKVQAEVNLRARSCQKQLEAMGQPRSDEASQRQCMVHIATRMQNITNQAVHGFYSGEALFKEKPNLRLATSIVKLNEAFSLQFWKNGHHQQFRDGEEEGEKASTDHRSGRDHRDHKAHRSYQKTDASVSGFDVSDASDASDDSDVPAVFNRGDNDDESDEHDFLIGTPSKIYDELAGIIDVPYVCPKPLKGPMTLKIREIYEDTRGPELGTFNGSILALAFAEASQKWEKIALSHTSQAIVLVHRYITELLNEVCPDATMQHKIWDFMLCDDLCDKYRKAMDHTRTLLDIERLNPPSTFNRRFNEILQQKRQTRLADKMSELSVRLPKNKTYEKKYVALDLIRMHVSSTENQTQVCEDVLDALESYYTVARDRFVDTLCQQVVYNMLLGGSQSPLWVLSANNVLQLEADQLEAIAGEAAELRKQRATVQREMQSLEQAKRVLRS